MAVGLLRSVQWNLTCPAYRQNDDDVLFRSGCPRVCATVPANDESELKFRERSSIALGR